MRRVTGRLQSASSSDLDRPVDREWIWMIEQWSNNDLVMIWMKLRMALLSAKIAKGTGGRHRVRRRCLSLILNHIHLHKGTYNLLLCARGWNVRCIFGGMKAFQWLALARCWSMRRLEIAGHWPLATGTCGTGHTMEVTLPMAVAPLPLSLNLEALPALPRGSEPSRLRRARRIRRLTSTLPPRKQQSGSQNCCYF